MFLALPVNKSPKHFQKHLKNEIYLYLNSFMKCRRENSDLIYDNNCTAGRTCALSKVPGHLRSSSENSKHSHYTLRKKSKYARNLVSDNKSLLHAIINSPEVYNNIQQELCETSKKSKTNRK